MEGILPGVLHRADGHVTLKERMCTTRKDVYIGGGSTQSRGGAGRKRSEFRRRRSGWRVFGYMEARTETFWIKARIGILLWG